MSTFTRAMRKLGQGSTAACKMEAVGLAGIHRAAQARHPDGVLGLQTVYRWREAMIDGRGVPDPAKMLLIEATADTAHAISWADFDPRTRPGQQDLAA